MNGAGRPHAVLFEPAPAARLSGGHQGLLDEVSGITPGKRSSYRLKSG
jgi:hypothetical protein